jgi:hypothetical protein
MPGRTCENCGAADGFRPLFRPRDEVERCVRCGGWRYVGALDEPAASRYDEGYFFGREYVDYQAAVPAQRLNFGRKLRLLASAGVACGAGTRLVEIGCATGEFLDVARGAGATEGIGIEVSAYGRQVATERGLRVFAPDAADLDAALAQLRPNLIVGWDVWEHLERPAAMLDRLLATATGDAAVALTTVDASSLVARLRGRRWRQFHPPTHLQYPTRASFRGLFAGRGLRIVSQRSFGYYRPALEYLAAVGVRPGTRRRLAKLLGTPVYLNLWDTQLVIARRAA